MSEFYADVGDRLKAYRLGKKISSDVMAEKLGISRAALYRYERGVAPKLETLEKISKILDVTLPSLLGVGVEYIASCVSFIERMRQIELETSHISVLFGPISYLLTTDLYDSILKETLIENIPHDIPDRDYWIDDIEKIMDLLQHRKVNYHANRPNILSLVSAADLQRFVHQGFIGHNHLSAKILANRKQAAASEIEHIIELLEEQPIGVQVGLLVDTIPNTGFQIFKQPSRDLLAISPFKLGDFPNTRLGVAMITAAPEAIKLHANITEQLWKRSLKGGNAIDYIKNSILP